MIFFSFTYFCFSVLQSLHILDLLSNMYLTNIVFHSVGFLFFSSVCFLCFVVGFKIACNYSVHVLKIHPGNKELS